MAEKANTKKTSSISKKKSDQSAKKATKVSGAKKKSATRKVSSKKASKKKATKKVAGKVQSSKAVSLEPELIEGNGLIKDEELSLEEQKVETVVDNHKQSNKNGLTINLSNSLLRKLSKQAEDEGVSLEDFVSELLAESVVLRAWEIVERKSQMRSTPSQNPNSRSGNSSGNSRNNNRKGRMSHGRYQSIMDDKATFLEYVRNQERSRR